MTNGRRQEGEFTPRPGELEGEGFVRYIRERVGDDKILDVIRDENRVELIKIMREALEDVDLSPANAASVADAFGEKLFPVVDSYSEISLNRHMINIGISIQRTVQGFINR